MYDTYETEYFAPYKSHSGTHKREDIEHPIHQTQIARPEYSETGYYTGVTHFRHSNNEDLAENSFSTF